MLRFIGRVLLHIGAIVLVLLPALLTVAALAALNTDMAVWR